MNKGQWDKYCRAAEERVQRVREQIAAASERSGRTPESVKLVSVTKYVTGTEGVEASLYAAGCTDFGENRASRLLDKWHLFNEKFHSAESEMFPPFFDPRRISWHFIGSLQRNKVRRILPYVSLIHSIDTPELYETVVRIMREENDKTETKKESSSDTPLFPEKVQVLLEVNISGEGNKHGFQPAQFLDQIGPLLEEKESRVEIRGLMGMGGLSSTPKEVRSQFAELRSLLESVQRTVPDRTNLTELSMGMSGDFEAAVEEGATIVRIGSILYP